MNTTTRPTSIISVRTLSAMYRLTHTQLAGLLTPVHHGATYVDADYAHRELASRGYTPEA